LIPAGEEVTVPAPVLATLNFAAWALAEISSEAPNNKKARMKRAAGLKRAASGNARNVVDTKPPSVSNRCTEPGSIGSAG
jgi:hypothetical protein